MISKRTTAIVLGLTMVCLIGCSSSKTVQVPPRMDLMRYGTIGMISFSSQDDSGLNDQASREFLAALQSVATYAIDGDMLDMHREDGARALTATSSP